jgi:hypothetical protein
MATTRDLDRNPSPHRSILNRLDELDAALGKLEHRTGQHSEELQALYSHIGLTYPGNLPQEEAPRLQYPSDPGLLPQVETRR